MKCYYQSCPDPCDSMVAPARLSSTKILPGKKLEQVAHFLLQGIYQAGGLNPRLYESCGTSFKIERTGAMNMRETIFKGVWD